MTVRSAGPSFIFRNFWQWHLPAQSFSVASVGIKDEDGAVFAGDFVWLAGGGALVEQIDAQRGRSFSALVRMAKDWTVFTARQDEFSCERLEECGRMTGGWPKQVARAKDAKDAKVNDTTDLSLYLPLSSLSF